MSEDLDYLKSQLEDTGSEPCPITSASGVLFSTDFGPFQVQTYLTVIPSLLAFSQLPLLVLSVHQSPLSLLS